MIIKKKLNSILYLLFLLLLTRIITKFFLDISFDEKWFFGLWQHAKKEYLIENLTETLLYFHAQPPLWNLLIGIGVKISEFLTLNYYFTLVNFFLTILIIYSSYQLLRILNFKKNQIIFLIIFLIIFSPSILFYENFPSYAHFSCTLLFLIKLNFLKIYKKYKLNYEIQIYIYSTFLILSWSAYIIYFNLLIFLLLLPLIIKKDNVLRSSCIFLIFLTIGMLPSIKNKIIFNVFLNSSWSGLNAAQATGYDRENWPLCSFNDDKLEVYNQNYRKFVKDREYFDKELLNDRSYNDLGYIFKSINCNNASKKYLIQNFIKITEQKIKRLASVHAHLSIDFAFKPKNWDKKFYILENLNNNEVFKFLVFLFFSVNYVYFFIITYSSLKNKNKNYFDYFLIINLILYMYLLFVSFYGSTWEQERMRYTGYSFIFISVSLIMKNILKKIFKIF